MIDLALVDVYVLSSFSQRSSSNKQQKRKNLRANVHWCNFSSVFWDAHVENGKQEASMIK